MSAPALSCPGGSASMGLQPEGRRGVLGGLPGELNVNASMGLQPEGRRGGRGGRGDGRRNGRLQWGSSPKAGEEALRIAGNVASAGLLQWGSSPKAGEESHLSARTTCGGTRFNGAPARRPERSLQPERTLPLLRSFNGAPARRPERRRRQPLRHAPAVLASMRLQLEGRRGAADEHVDGAGAHVLQWGSSSKAGEERRDKRIPAVSRLMRFNGAPARRPERRR